MLSWTCATRRIRAAARRGELFSVYTGTGYNVHHNRLYPIKITKYKSTRSRYTRVMPYHRLRLVLRYWLLRFAVCQNQSQSRRSRQSLHPVAVPARRAWSGRWRRSPPEVPLPLVAWPTTLRHTFGFEPLTFGMPGPLGSALWVTANPPARVSPATWCAAAVVGRASTGSRACFTCVTYIRAYSCPPRLRVLSWTRSQPRRCVLGRLEGWTPRLPTTHQEVDCVGKGNPRPR